MATASSNALTDAELVYQELGKLLANGGREKSVDWLLSELAEYYRQLQQVRALLRKAEESSARGESKPFDVEDIIRRGRERMKSEGITD
jgi:hypothetical protein